eukprot:jgi/Mesvir1/20285/Mv19894-RA.1
MPPSPGNGVILSGSLRHAIDEAQKSQKLVVTSSIILTIPQQITSLVNLTHLDLTSNCLKNLPRDIGQLRALTCLRLGWNKLSFLPPEIGHLTSLQELCLGFNQLRSLPRQLGCLCALQRLQLNDNCLESIPPEIGLLNKLVDLQLSYNALETLPPELGLLVDSLSMLVLSGNPLQDPGPETLADGTLAVLRHLHDTFEGQGGTRPVVPSVEEASSGGRNMPANVLSLEEELADGLDLESPGGTRLPGSPSLSRQRSGSDDRTNGGSPSHKSRGHAGTRSAGRSSRKGSGGGGDRPATAMPSFSASFSALSPSPLSGPSSRPPGTAIGTSPGLPRPTLGSHSPDRATLASSSSTRRPGTASAASFRRPGSASAFSRQMAAAGDDESAGAMLASMPILQGSLAAAAHSLSRVRANLAPSAADGGSSRLEALREASSEGGSGEGEGAELDCVRDLLRSRNPDLLRSLDALIEDDDEPPSSTQRQTPSWRSSFNSGQATSSGGGQTPANNSNGPRAAPGETGADERDASGNVLAASEGGGGGKDRLKVPQQYLCPITYEIMQDPVMATDGRTYERQAIIKWFAHHGTSPVTGEELSSLDVTNNFTLRSMIREFEESQKGQEKQRRPDEDEDKEEAEGDEKLHGSLAAETNDS